MNTLVEQLRHGIVVSVQASLGEPLDKPDILCALAEAALNGGARALRMADEKNIRHFKRHHPRVPVLGITKPEKIPTNYADLVYITPSWADIEELAACADIIAMDATGRERPGGETLETIVARARQEYPQLPLMADIATLEDGLRAEQLGFDLISTTLAGYTRETQGGSPKGPDFALLGALVSRVKTPVILEGRVWEPVEVSRAFELGAFSVVIGSAITRPHEITRRFVQAAPVPS